MANIGFKGGDVLDVDLYNRFVDILNYYKKANFVLSTNVATSNSDTNTTQRFSFKQQKSYLTIIKVLISKSTIATFDYPRILSSVDKNNVAVAYTHISDSVESFIKKDAVTDYNIYILKTKYSTPHADDVWLDVRLLGSSFKDYFSSKTSQWMVAQHDDTETLIPHITRGDVADSTTYWQPIKAFLGSSNLMSFVAQLSDTSGTSIAKSEILRNFYSNDYLKNIEGFCYDDIRIERISDNGDIPGSFAVASTKVSYAKGDKFGNIEYSEVDYSYSYESSYFQNVYHISFKYYIYIIRLVTSDMSLSSVDLMMLKWFVDAFSYLQYGKMRGSSDLNVQTIADSSAQIEIVKSAENYITLGTDIKIYFEL